MKKPLKQRLDDIDADMVGKAYDVGCRSGEKVGQLALIKRFKRQAKKCGHCYEIEDLNNNIEGELAVKVLVMERVLDYLAAQEKKIKGRN
jgi:hypothetical protein